MSKNVFSLTGSHTFMRMFFCVLNTAIFIVALLLINVPSSASANSAAQNYKVAISKIRFGTLSGGGTRVVLESNAKVNPQLLLLNNPHRIVIDMPSTRWAYSGSSKPIGVINRYRHNNFDQKTYRLVLDLKRPAVVAKSFSMSPRGGYGYRYVIDLKPTSSQAFASAASKSIKVNKQKSFKGYSDLKGYSSKKNRKKKVIVLDAGHGGKDVGTVGRFGAHESVLTLRMARELKAKLDATGRYKVYLTRNSNILLDLRRRYEIARRFDADLFVSIHVDAVANPKTSGGSVYTLSERSSDAEAARLAAKENRADIIAGIDLSTTDKQVSDILIELAQRETMNYSSQFAEILVKEMRNKNVKMLRTAHRFAPFMVLKAPDVPSVLIETGFQTNKGDAKMLNSKWGRAKLINGIAQGIDQYFKTVKTQF